MTYEPKEIVDATGCGDTYSAGYLWCRAQGMDVCTNGFEQHKGPAVSDFTDAQTKQAILPNAKINVVISDSSKASTSALVQYASWRDIDYFITDSNLPKPMYDMISEMTNVILVDIHS